MLSNINLADFDLTAGPTKGKGLVGTKWAKWAICNGNLTNAVDDLRLQNLRDLIQMTHMVMMLLILPQVVILPLY